MELILIVIVAALAFEYINGFHDTAISIATSVSTKVLTPRQAVVMAASFNLVGALVGTSVAATIGRGLVDTSYVTPITVFCALFAAIIWNLATWWLGLPSSSSHALVGGLCGATLAAAHGKWAVIKWSVVNAGTGKAEGLLHKIIWPMFTAPVIGMLAGCLLMLLLLFFFHRYRPMVINRVFGRLQLVSAAWMGFSHGTNDAQKTMGIIALLLFTGTQAGSFDHLPAGLAFLRTPTFEVAPWVKIACAITMAAGTAAGGWRIIRTLGHKVVRLQPIHGFAAQTTAAGIIHLASHFGIPLSTTQVISASIVGVGTTKRFSAVKWGMVGKIVWAWVLTAPVTAILGYWMQKLWLLARH
ncbi:MAG: inorganic phosphate transporter [bacterium]